MTQTTHTPEALLTRLPSAAPGDTLVIANGRYDGVSLTLDARGEPDRPLTIRAENSGDVIFTGSSSLRAIGAHIAIENLHFEHCDLEESCILLDGATDCRVTRCQFTHSGGRKAAISIQGTASGNQIDHCEFAHLEQRSVQVIIRGETAAADNRINFNLFRDIPPIPSGNGRETIQIGQNQRDWGHVEPRTAVEHNTFLRCDGEIEIISNKSSRNFYRRNLFKDCKGELVMRGGSHCEIHRNRHENCTGGIRLSGTHHNVTHNLILDCVNGFRVPYGMTIEQGGLYQAVTGCLVAYNTVIDFVKVGLQVGTNRMMDRKEMGIAKHPPYKNRFINNIFSSASRTQCVVNEAPDNEIRNNIFSRDEEDAGGDVPAGNIITDPRLGPDYRPLDGSPALGAAPTDGGGDTHPDLGAEMDRVGPSARTEI